MPRSKPGTFPKKRKHGHFPFFHPSATCYGTAYLDFTDPPEIDVSELELANASNHYVRRGHGQ